MCLVKLCKVYTGYIAAIGINRIGEHLLVHGVLGVVLQSGGRVNQGLQSHLCIGCVNLFQGFLKGHCIAYKRKLEVVYSQPVAGKVGIFITQGECFACVNLCGKRIVMEITVAGSNIYSLVVEVQLCTGYYHRGVSLLCCHSVGCEHIGSGRQFAEHLVNIA